MTDTIAIPHIKGLSEDQVRTLMNCRTLKQFAGMVTDYRASKCTFCDPLGPKNKVLKGFGGWRVWLNPFPLKHTSRHYVFAPADHMTHLHDMSSDDWDNASAIIDWVVNAESGIGLDGGAIVWRFGPPQFNAGSVLHLHGNIIVPDGSGDVQATLGKGSIKMAEIVARVLVFKKLHEGTALAKLNAAERRLVEGRLE